MQKVNLIDDHQANQLGVGTLVTSLSCDDVPLFGSRHNDLGLIDLSFGEVHITTQLSNRHSIGLLQALAEALHHFLHQGLHGSNVDDLEASQVKGTVLQAELIHHVQNRQHGHIGLATTSGRTHQHVLSVLLKGSLEHLTLHGVELCGSRECLLAPGWQLGQGDQILRIHIWVLERLHVHFFVTLLLHSEGTSWQLALGIGHEMATSREGQGVQVQHVGRLLLLLLCDLGPSSTQGLTFIVHSSLLLTCTSQLELTHLLSQIPVDIALPVTLL
mmetsp:Transcript_87455/g.138909  ORF Transcript_87455/g.138909 Transcript_87455/m.138909 type:complete len:273 (+) Transcript_87455:4605-5423(+)